MAPKAHKGGDDVAVGMANGRVLVSSFEQAASALSLQQDGSEERATIMREFVPHHSRACNVLAWNPVHTVSYPWHGRVSFGR